MQTRLLGKTGLQLPILSFGASSLGAEFRSVKLDEALDSVRVALDCGLNFIDTSPFYGRGMSEMLLGIALKGVPRDSYTLCTKLGRYDLSHFDFSAKRVAESVDVSLHRLGTDHLDIILCGVRRQGPARDARALDLQDPRGERCPSRLPRRAHESAQQRRHDLSLEGRRRAAADPRDERLLRDSRRASFAEARRASPPRRPRHTRADPDGRGGPSWVGLAMLCIA